MTEKKVERVGIGLFFCKTMVSPKAISWKTMRYSLQEVADLCKALGK